MTAVWLLLVLSVGGVFASLAPRSATAVDATVREPRYFTETGFWAQGAVREYWETRGGLPIFGYPITSLFLDTDGLYKQYFERAVFEFHPEHVGTPYEVLLQRLGAQAAANRAGEGPFQPVSNAAGEACDFFPETNHHLCLGFRGYWHANGGLFNFGYPMSEEFQEQNQPPPAGDGRSYVVQYFERIRFEWHPEHKGTPYEFQLGLLGTEYLLRHGAPEEALRRASADVPPLDPTRCLTPAEPAFRYGFNISWNSSDTPEGQAFNQRTLQTICQAGFGAFRFQVVWASHEPEPGTYNFDSLERLVAEAERQGLYILASVVKAPAWAEPNGGEPADPEPFRRFMETLARHFDGRIAAYEIWNEQNVAGETGGHVDIGRYVGLLKAGYTGVKAGAPNALVVFGGLSPTGVNDPTLAIDDRLYLETIYAHNGGEIKQYFDVLGVHPGSNDNAPDQWWPGNPGTDGWTDHNSFYFRRVEDLRTVMVANGDEHKPIWLTEFGWSTSNPAPGREYGAFNSEQAQAQYLVRAFEIARTEWPWVTAMFVWNLNFAVVVDGQSHMGPWSVLYSDWSPRPAYDALMAMPK